MENLFTLDNLFTLGMLIVLQAVLGFDNLLYISIESKRAAEDRQAFVRRWGIGLAIGLRIVLLYVVVSAIGYFQDPLLTLAFSGVLEGTVNGHSLIVLFGGIFILYTAMKEIMHMLAVDDIGHSGERKPGSVFKVMGWIIAMNLVFSFDSILSAMALTDVFVVMAAAIVVSGILMLWLADHVTEFLKRNRMYEVLGLFILFIVGILLVSEGGHLAHLKLFGYAVEPMAKTTFYFVIAIMVAVDIVQSRYRQKLMQQRESELAH
jgi:predicted tellurium resistance membrane protein TerC